MSDPKNKLTEMEQAEIKAYIRWKSGTGPEPDWYKMPQWIIDIEQEIKDLHSKIEKQSNDSPVQNEQNPCGCWDSSDGKFHLICSKHARETST